MEIVFMVKTIITIYKNSLLKARVYVYMGCTLRRSGLVPAKVTEVAVLPQGLEDRTNVVLETAQLKEKLK